MLFTPMRKNSSKVTSINDWIQAAMAGKFQLLKQNKLLYQGQQTVVGKTALMFSASNGHKYCVQLLLLGEQMNKDKDGVTALICAVSQGQLECVQLLLIEAKQQNKYGCTALMHAVENNRLECVKLLLMEAKMQDVNGGTALMYAAQKGRVELIPLLLAEKRMRNVHGDTALMFAASEGHDECVKLLTDEVGMRNKEGDTALMLACRCGYVECVKILIEEVEIQNKQGKFPLEILNEKLYEEQNTKQQIQKYQECIKIIGEYLQPTLDAIRIVQKNCEQVQMDSENIVHQTKQCNEQIQSTVNENQRIIDVLMLSANE